MTVQVSRVLARVILPFVVNTLVLAPAWSQESDEWVFDEEESMDFSEPMEFGEEEGDDWGEDSWGEDDWVEGEWDATETAPAATPDAVVDDGVVTVTALVIPGGPAGPAEADALTSVLMAELANLAELGEFEVVSNEPLRTEFDIMGGEFARECAFDPVCLGRYGRQLGLDKVVVGRVDLNDLGQWSVTVDLIEAAQSTVANYRVFVTEPSVDGVAGATNSQLRTLFRIRREQTTASVGRSGPSPVQKALAWTTLGLGVASLGVGFAFGAQAGGLEDELSDCDLVPSAGGDLVCAQTQVAAQSTIDDGKSKAALANVFIGTGLLLTVGSIVLFTVTPGGDIDDDAQASDANRRIRNLRFSPTVGARSAGFAGSFDF